MTARDVKEKQRSFQYRTWGGKRAGAGRPKRPGAKLRHGARPPLARSLPVHVTLRAVPGAPSLRRAAIFAALETALRAARAADDFRVVHFSVQSNHLHLIVEAHDARALSRGMQGLTIRAALRVNRAAGRKGKLWADRYHAHVLRTPREVRHAICYVLQNARRHADQARGMFDPEWIDPRSSGRWFDGWRDRRGVAGTSDPPVTCAARTWLLAEGWRRHGLIRVDEVPAAALRGSTAALGARTSTAAPGARRSSRRATRR